ARAGLARGQASAWVMGAAAWRILALHALGRWDEALADAALAERAWADSEVRAPSFSLSGLLAAFTISRNRGDAVGAEHWRELVLRVFKESDPGIRNHRLRAYIDGDFDQLASTVIADFRTFTGRMDYVAISAWLLGDHRHATDIAALDDLVGYAKERSLQYVLAPAIRLRGLVRRDAADLEAALEIAT